MKTLCLFLALTGAACAATITSGSFTAFNLGDAGGTTQNSSIAVTLSGGNIANFAFFWGPVNSPQIIDFSGSFGFNNTYTNLPVLFGSVVVSGTTYTFDADTFVTLNMQYSAGPPIPYTLGTCTPPIPQTSCAAVSGVPFTMTGSITLTDQGSVVYTEALEGSGTASATRKLGNPVGGVTGTYTFTSTPEPGSIVQIASGLAALGVFAGLRRRRPVVRA